MEKFFSGTIGSERAGFSGMNPYENFQSMQKYPSMPYQFPSGGVVHQNPFIHDAPFEAPVGIDSGNNHGYGLKYGSGTGYGHTAVETQSHYGPPQMHSKGGKLKGAALSALTLLAFLFFLNLLQSCLKEQMDVMNPTVCVCANSALVPFNHHPPFQVMVMSAGQRNYLINRNDDIDNNQFGKDDVDFDKFDSSETEHKADVDSRLDYDSDDYRDADAVKKAPKVRARSKSKKTRIKTIEPKLNNFSASRNTRLVS